MNNIKVMVIETNKKVENNTKENKNQDTKISENKIENGLNGQFGSIDFQRSNTNSGNTSIDNSYEPIFTRNQPNLINEQRQYQSLD